MVVDVVKRLNLKKTRRFNYHFVANFAVGVGGSPPTYKAGALGAAAQPSPSTLRQHWPAGRKGMASAQGTLQLKMGEAGR